MCILLCCSNSLLSTWPVGIPLKEARLTVINSVYRVVFQEKVEKKADDNYFLQETRIQKLEEALMEERAHVSELQAV